MKRAKSTICIHDLQESTHQANRNRQRHTKVASVLPSTRSLSYLINKEKSYLINKENEVQPHNKKGKQGADRNVYCLEKQIVEVEQQIQNSQALNKNYAKELAEYQKITNNIQRVGADKAKQTEKLAELKNQLLMIRQQRQSAQFNADQRVAEKQYFQQLIASYKREYEEESSQVMQLIELQEQAVLLTKEIQDLQNQLKVSESKLREWKEQTGFDLNQHKIRNSIKMARMELIRLQDACDAHCSHYKLKRIRELCCQYFKIYAKKNGVGLQEAEEGVDIFFCRTGIVHQFREFLSERIIYNKPECSEFQQYFETLLSIEKIYRSSRNKISQNTHSLQIYEVSRLKQLKQYKRGALNEVRQSIKSKHVQIDKQFGIQSLAVIEYLRERNNNKYDISEIKIKLKENKTEMTSRVNKIKEAHRNIQHLQNTICRDMQPINRSPYQPNISCLQLQIENQQQIIAAIDTQLQKLVKDKDSLQIYISNAVSKWRERQEKKDHLKQLYQELSQAKQTNNYAYTRNEQPKGQPLPAQKTMQGSNYTNRLIRRDSTTSLHNSKSVLSVSNPYKSIMQKQNNVYQPIIEDCQLILSKQLSRHKAKQSELCGTEKSKTVKNKLCGESVKKTVLFNKSEKENHCQNKTTSKSKSMLMSQTNYTISAKPSITLQSANKPKRSENLKQSLSKLLLSKFNR